MTEGFGVFNIGIGTHSTDPSGKSSLLNDILFPSIENHEFIETNDKNAFSNGQVDVCFLKSFHKNRKLVMMDGHGKVSDEAIENCTKLSNIFLIHFSRRDVEIEQEIE